MAKDECGEKVLGQIQEVFYAREFKFYLKSLGEVGVGGNQRILGRGVTYLDLCFRKITLVAVWRKVWGRVSFLTQREGGVFDINDPRTVFLG